MKRETLMVVREKERERAITRKLGFICDAKNTIDNTYKDIIKRIEYHVEKL